MSALSVGDASRQILADIRRLESERIPLRDALDRVLAADVVSSVTLPRWDNSSMDGYAVRGAEVVGATAGSPVILPVVGTIGAGHRADQPLPSGAAIRIMTGAPLPAGADSVIRVEDTDGGVDRVSIVDARDVGRNVRPRGEELEAGAVAVPCGTTLGPSQIGVLASVGAATVDVWRRPRVAVLATGDELVDVDHFDLVQRGDRIISSNSYTLCAAVQSAGGVVHDLGIAPDDRAELRRHIERARDAGCDLLITTGGISVGAFDFTRAVLEALGAHLKLWRVRMRPGAPVGFGLLGAMPWIGLPGNPVSTMVTFELFARPAIRKQRGESLLFRRMATVIVDEPVTIAAPLTHFLRANVRIADDGTMHARLTGPQGSGLLTSMARADALLIIPPERPRILAGESVRALPLGEGVTLASDLVLS